jgi:sortase B
MKNGTMFSDLLQLYRCGFLQGTSIINFDTLSSFGEYQVIAVFKFDTNHEDFRYNEYTQMNEEQFKEFMSQVHARQCYDTGIDAEYGDQLITLSTCEYTYNNGRFVVVAKKV